MTCRSWATTLLLMPLVLHTCSVGGQGGPDRQAEFDIHHRVVLCEGFAWQVERPS
jgi:hypothetical protein